MFKILIGAAIGAAAAWFLDQNDGTRRRNVVRDKAMKYARQGKEQAARKATYAGETVKGKATSAAPGAGREPAEERLNDEALKAKVESEIFRDPDAPKGKVAVNVEDGVVHLRGEVEDTATSEGLREAATNVEGVRGVENLLTTPA
jgi:osmotically-inducible protein OsmY